MLRRFVERAGLTAHSALRSLPITLMSALLCEESFVLKRAIENLRSLSGARPRLARSHDSLRFQIAAPHKSSLGVIFRSLSLQTSVNLVACIGTR